MSAFVDYVRSDAELRRAYLTMLNEKLELLTVRAGLSAATWDEVLRERGGYTAINQLVNDIQGEEKEHAARRSYEDRSGHR